MADVQVHLLDGHQLTVDENDRLADSSVQSLNGVTAGTVTASKFVKADANKDVTGLRNVTATGSFIIGSASMDETDLEKLDGITNGTQAANKAVVADANVNTGVSKITALHIGTSGSETQVTATAAELNYLDIATLGTGAVSKAVVLDGSGNYAMPDNGFLNLSNAALAAAGSGQSTYATIADQTNAVTGADGTKGVALPAALAGRAILVTNTSTTAPLPVAPVNGGNDQINSLTAGTGVFTMGPGRSAWFIPTSSTQWYVSDLAGMLATSTEIDRVADVSTRLVAGGSALALTEALHDGKTVLFDTAAGTTLTLPAATGSGAKFRCVVSVLCTSNSHILKVVGDDIMQGSIGIIDTDTADATIFFATETDSDTITFNRTTTGLGEIGAWIEVQDIAANTWSVMGVAQASGSVATPFSAAVT